MIENTEHNYTRIAGIIIVIGVLIFLVIPWNIIFPVPVKIIPPKIIYVNTTQTIYVKVTPTSEDGYYYSNEFTNGTRKINHPFTWIKEDVTGLKDMRVSVNVYDYRILTNGYHWFNIYDYKYYLQTPENSKDEFLFVFIHIEMNDISGDDTRLYLPSRNMFAVQSGKNVYAPIDYPLELRINELENTNDYYDVSKIEAYGQKSITESVGSNTGYQYSEKQDYLRGGKSNSQDGYIIYEIPKNTSIKDILILGSFYSFGSAQWRLT